MNDAALQVWVRLQKLNDLEHKINAAILGEKEPPYDLRKLHHRVKKELSHTTHVWHNQFNNTNA